MAVKEETVKNFQGYSIIRIRETNAQDQLIMETFALSHAAGGVIAEYAILEDAIQELNRMLFPLPGLAAVGSHEAL